jgi:RNA polymerase sigma-70 factor (ECF subfamily)
MSRSSKSSPSQTSTSLLDRARQENPDAWNRLSRLYGPLVYEWARIAGLPPEDASDVMQSVFVSVTQNLAQFRVRDEGDSFRGWLYTITRNKIHDHFRKSQRQVRAAGGTEALQSIQQIAAAAASTDSTDGQQEINQLYRRAVQLVQGEFAGRTWICFWRTAVEGDAPADIAADMEMSVWAVYKARSRVLQRLRHEFGELLE